ncbi:hypothetical protein STEG23_027556, partial [Scotinomys teguina]
STIPFPVFFSPMFYPPLPTPYPHFAYGDLMYFPSLVIHESLSEFSCTPLCICTFLIHSSIEVHLGYIQVLAIANNVTMNIDMEQCMSCPEEQYPNTEHTHCLQRHVSFLAYEDPLGMTLACISLCFSALTVLVLGAFVKYKDTPIVKANNRILSYILLIAITFCFLCSLLFIGHPHTVTCILQQTTFGVFFTLAVSTVLAKTITVVLAFKLTTPGKRLRGMLVSGAPKFVIPICTVVQLILCGIWLVTSPPFIDTDTHSEHGQIIIVCNKGSFSLMLCSLTETNCFWRIKHNEEDDGDFRNDCEFVLFLLPEPAEEDLYNTILDFRRIPMPGYIQHGLELTEIQTYFYLLKVPEIQFASTHATRKSSTFFPRITPRTLEFFLVLIFATEEINQNPYLLPNMTLRFTITSGTCFETLKVIDSKSLPKDFYTRLLNYECGINVCDIFLTGPSWSISVKLTIGTLCPKVPTSTCSLTCTAGFRKFHEEHRADCCFDCAFCPENEVSNETDFKFTFRPCPDSLQKTDKDPNMKMCRGRYLRSELVIRFPEIALTSKCQSSDAVLMDGKH